MDAKRFIELSWRAFAAQQELFAIAHFLDNLSFTCQDGISNDVRIKELFVLKKAISKTLTPLKTEKTNAPAKYHRQLLLHSGFFRRPKILPTKNKHQTRAKRCFINFTAVKPVHNRITRQRDAISLPVEESEACTRQIDFRSGSSR